VSLDIKQVDRIGIIGRNGAGKSNFLKKINLHCMTEPTCGKIFIKRRLASLLKVGICLDSELTGRDNIELK
jgi:lipopolysaccharide transport system ATP-binding protein